MIKSLKGKKIILKLILLVIHIILNYYIILLYTYNKNKSLYNKNQLI